MWHTTTKVSIVSTALGAYLESAKHDALIRDETARGRGPRGLFDIIEHWACIDSNILVFGSYENMLISMFDVTTQWATSNGTAVAGFSLWVDPQSGEPQTVPYLDQDAYERAWEFGVVHRFFVRSNFEFQMAEARTLQERAMHAQLSQLRFDDAQNRNIPQ